MKLRDRLVFSVANLERGAGPALYMVVNHVLPKVMHLALGDRFELISDVPYRHVGGDTLRLDIVKPEGDGPFPVVIGIHGGAWMLGRKENIRHAASYFARRGIMSVLINYRLATDHPWPACGEDVAAAMKWVKGNAHRYGGRGDRIGLFGDSAGGHLSAYGAVAIAGAPDHDPDLPEVAAAAHWYGVFDMASFARVPWRRTPQILESLFGKDRSHDPEAFREFSPRSYLDAATRIPPTMLFAAGGDPLYKQSMMYARELEARGVPVELKKYKLNIHGFLNLPFSPECRASLKHAARWFRTHLEDAGRAAA